MLPPLLDGYLDPDAPTFVDVPSDNQFFDEIETMAARGIATGWGEGRRRTYRPLEPVGRDAMAAFLYRTNGSAAFTPPPRSPFTDVTPSTQFYVEICWLAATGIATGYPDGTFRPIQPIARDAMAAFLYRYRFGGETGTPYTAPAASPFRDVVPGQQFYREMCWMREDGISTGYPDGTFRPLVPVARDAMAAFLVRLGVRSPKHLPQWMPADLATTGRYAVRARDGGTEVLLWMGEAMDPAPSNRGRLRRAGGPVREIERVWVGPTSPGGSAEHWAWREIGGPGAWLVGPEIGFVEASFGGFDPRDVPAVLPGLSIGRAYTVLDVFGDPYDDRTL